VHVIHQRMIPAKLLACLPQSPLLVPAMPELNVVVYIPMGLRVVVYAGRSMKKRRPAVFSRSPPFFRPPFKRLSLWKPYGRLLCTQAAERRDARRPFLETAHA